MWWGRTQLRPQTEVQALKASALEDNAARAGFALVCSYANSNEYEAELIAARREAGLYGPRRSSWKARIAAIAAGLLTLVVLIVLTT